MKHEPNRILAINAGSSSIKFAIFSADDGLAETLRGRIERVGYRDASLHIRRGNQPEEVTIPIAARDHAAAVRVLWERFSAKGTGDTLLAVGHRIVHGGSKYSAPCVIDPELLDELRRLSPFDPEHLPEEILIVEAFHQRFPDLLQVACFDTHFHRDLPRVARILPIPRRYEASGVRRYGFHGLSYESAMQEITRENGADAANGRLVIMHIGSGVSVTAVSRGKAIDTTMGFTPSGGVPMGTRSGDIDPGLMWYLARTDALDANRLRDLVTTQSGLLGISETSADMRDLLLIELDDVRAAEAIAFFAYQLKKMIGAYAVALGGVDMLVFTGGIGENAPTIRTRICAGLEFLGVTIDETKNTAEKIGTISRSDGKVCVRVVRTDEEKMIAASVLATMRAQHPHGDHKTHASAAANMSIGHDATT